MTAVPGPLWSPLRLRSSSASRAGNSTVAVTLEGIVRSVVQRRYRAVDGPQRNPAGFRPRYSPAHYYSFRKACVPVGQRDAKRTADCLPFACGLQQTRHSPSAATESRATRARCETIAMGLRINHGEAVEAFSTRHHCNAPWSARTHTNLLAARLIPRAPMAVRDG